MEIPGGKGYKGKVPSVGGGIRIISGTTHCMEGEFEQIITKLLLSIKDNNY